MHRITLAALAAATLALSAQAGEWKTLFDGSNFDAWTLKDGGWSVEDGAMKLNAKGGYAWTRESFGDFALELEFKVSAGCNSGVFFRSDPKDPVQRGFEIQVLDSAGKPNPGKHDCGALYDALAPSANAMQAAGEWNKMVVTCQGAKLKVELNGKTVVDADLDQWTTPNQNPDGSKNKFKTALKDLPRTGQIGFQDHGQTVWYRNVRIQALP